MAKRASRNSRSSLCVAELVLVCIRANSCFCLAKAYFRYARTRPIRSSVNSSGDSVRVSGCVMCNRM
jgi:hypothetical protein